MTFTIARWEAMQLMIRSGGARTADELAWRLIRPKTAVTESITWLERRGYVTNTPAWELTAVAVIALGRFRTGLSGAQLRALREIQRCRGARTTDELAGRVARSLDGMALTLSLLQQTRLYPSCSCLGAYRERPTRPRSVSGHANHSNHKAAQPHDERRARNA